MTKDQVLFYLNRIRKEYESLSQEEMAKRGMSYARRLEAENKKTALSNEVEALEIAIRIVENQGFIE